MVSPQCLPGAFSLRVLHPHGSGPGLEGGGVQGIQRPWLPHIQCASVSWIDHCSDRAQTWHRSVSPLPSLPLFSSQTLFPSGNNLMPSGPCPKPSFTWNWLLDWQDHLPHLPASLPLPAPGSGPGQVWGGRGRESRRSSPPCPWNLPLLHLHSLFLHTFFGKRLQPAPLSQNCLSFTLKGGDPLPWSASHSSYRIVSEMWANLPYCIQVSLST